MSGQHAAANRGGVALARPLHVSTEVPASFEATLGDAAFIAPAGVHRSWTTCVVAISQDT